MNQIAYILAASEPTRIDYIFTPLLLVVLVWLSLYDIRTLRLPDIATVPLIAIGLALATWRHSALPVHEIIGTLVGFSLFAAIGAYYFKTRGIDGLGLGDAKLLAAAGAWLGWQSLPLLILISAVSGIAFVFVSGRDKSSGLPFGPMLSLAFFLVWVFFLFSRGA